MYTKIETGQLSVEVPAGVDMKDAETICRERLVCGAAYEIAKRHESLGIEPQIVLSGACKADGETWTYTFNVAYAFDEQETAWTFAQACAVPLMALGGKRPRMGGRNFSV